MIVCIPFVNLPEAPYDYEALAKSIQKLGTFLTHSLHVVSRSEDEQAAYEFGQTLADNFARTTQGGLPEAPRNAYQLSNDLFRAAVRFIRDYRPKEGETENLPLLYLDPGYRPQVRAWLDEIQAEYYLNGTPRITVRGKTTADGALAVEGPVLLNRGYYESSGLLNHIPENESWRNWLRWEHKNTAKETKLFGQGGASVLKPVPKSKP